MYVFTDIDCGTIECKRFFFSSHVVGDRWGLFQGKIGLPFQYTLLLSLRNKMAKTSRKPQFPVAVQNFPTFIPDELYYRTYTNWNYYWYVVVLSMHEMFTTQTINKIFFWDTFYCTSFIKLSLLEIKGWRVQCYKIVWPAVAT